MIDQCYCIINATRKQLHSELELQLELQLVSGSVGLVHSVITNHTHAKLERYRMHFSVHWRILGLIMSPALILLMNMYCSQQVKLQILPAVSAVSI